MFPPTDATEIFGDDFICEVSKKQKTEKIQNYPKKNKKISPSPQPMVTTYIQEDLTEKVVVDVLDSPANNTRSKCDSKLVITELSEGQIFHTNKLGEVRAALKAFTSFSQGFEIGTLSSSDLSDTSRGRRLVMGCSRGGQSKKKKNILRTGNPKALCYENPKPSICENSTDLSACDRKARQSSSLKCGCEWKIVVKYLPEKGYCQVKEFFDTHTNGCSPSPIQQAAVRARRGDNLAHISVPLAVTLRALFRSHTKPSAIRDILREHKVVSDSEPIYAHALINLKMKLFKMGNNLDKWESVNFESLLSIQSDDKVTLARFAREWVKDHMNEDNGANVLVFLKELKEKYPGFEYRVARDSNRYLTGWMFMTAEMRYFARLFGDVLCDFQALKNAPE